MTTPIPENVHGGADGFDASLSDSYTIALGVSVGSDQNGFSTDTANVSLDTHGNVFGMGILDTVGFGIEYNTDATGTVTNESDGIITGYNIGFVTAGSNVTLNNNGAVIGVHDQGYIATGTGDQLVNTGLITGPRFAVDENQLSAGDGGVVTNSGTIRSDDIGIESSPQTTGVGATTIHNLAGGVIRGGTAAIQADSGGSIALTNDAGGTIDGAIFCLGDAANTIINHGTIKGTVNFDAGNDTFIGTGGRSGAIFGGDGNDSLVGGIGPDLIDGGLGHNTLTGGPGRDQFVFDSALAGSFDRITDFTPHVDMIVLSQHVFTHIGAALIDHALTPGLFVEGKAFTTTAQRIDYNPANGHLVYDGNGSAPGGHPVLFATLLPHLTLHANDFMVVA
jgi:Ca2+-binding RTX toxin-like protein